MDGVENVVFKNLEIYDLHEKSDLGSELCGDYWDCDPLAFTGQGHFLQNSPYFYGYTGNRAHGIMSDWSEYTLSGDVSFHDFTCDTGLIRGIGMYTSTQVTFDEDTSLSFADFSAGDQLYDTDVESLSAPYNPAESKPMHIVWEHYDSTAGDTFYAKIYGEPAEYSATCLLGREGYDDSDWTVTVDNSADECTAKMQTVNVQSVKARSVKVNSANTHSSNVWWMTVSIVVLGLLFAIWNISSHCRHSKVLAQTEIEPLLVSA